MRDPLDDNNACTLAHSYLFLLKALGSDWQQCGRNKQPGFRNKRIPR